jgi:transposase
MDAALWKMRMPRDRQKLEERRKEAVQLVNSGRMTPIEVARQMGVNRTTVHEWLRMYREEGGMRALRSKDHPKKACYLTPEQDQELRRMILEGATKHGFDSDLWTCPRVRALILRRFGVKHGVSSIPWVLRRLGFSPQKPESRAIERDERKIRGWVKVEFERIKKRPEAGSHTRLHR